MPSIVPVPKDTQDEAHHVCPTCGRPAAKAVNRETSTGTINTDALCSMGHIWSVHWMGVA